MKKVLTIAGSDSCGGAGVQADIKTFSALGTYGMSVITAVTAQNTLGVKSVRELDEEIIRDQIDAIFTDIKVDAVKIGMVSSSQIINTIGDALLKYRPENIVVDPVMVSKSGCHLLKPEARDALIKVLLPLAGVTTPNLYEAEVITGRKIKSLPDMEKAAVDISKMGARSVVVKGGHLEGTRWTCSMTVRGSITLKTRGSPPVIHMVPAVPSRRPLRLSWPGALRWKKL